MHPHHLCIFICRYRKLYYYCTLTSVSTLIFLTNWPPICLLFIKWRTWWYVTDYLHALIQLYYSFTSSFSVLHWYITAPLCKFRISCTCCSPAKYLWFEPFFGFADILAIRVVFPRISCWFSQYPYPSPISMWIYHHYENYWWNTFPANFTGVPCPLYFAGVTCPLYIISMIACIIFHISSCTSPNW